MSKGKRRRGGFRSRRGEARSNAANARECETCGAALAPDARFCHRCGTPLTGGDSRKRVRIAVYSVAALSVITVTLAAALFTYVHRDEPAPPAMENMAAGAPSSIDLSTMTPRQAADRLFNRVMRASERGDSAEAARFAPMAVAAYGRVADLDLDARYHLGLLYLQLGELEQVRGQIAIMKQSAPRHLLALVLEHDVASRAGDSAAAERAAAEFADAYEAQMAAPRPEYVAHKFALDRFRSSGAASVAPSAAEARQVATDPGAALFERHCAECHGREAEGTDQGPPLVHRIYEPSHHGDASFYRAVRQGVRGHHWPFGDMPPVEGVNGEEIGRIVAYVRNLQRAAGIE